MNTPPRSQGDPGTVLLLWEIQQTARIAGRVFERAVEAVGITAADYGVLACVNDDPGITQAGIARQLQVRPQTLTRTTTRLRDLGHLHGAPSGRGRHSDLHITDSGRRLLDLAWPHILALNSPPALGLDHDTIQQVATRLQDLRQHLRDHERKTGTRSVTSTG